MLRLSREADYGLIALMYMAARPEGRLAYRREIAAAHGIPTEFLAKVLQKLARGGLIRSYRGTQGGYALARTPAEITLADVVAAVEGPMALVECQCEEYTCSQEPACTVKLALTGVQREILRVLACVSLVDIGRGGPNLAQSGTPRHAGMGRT
jgi:Rrf2 family protein